MPNQDETGLHRVQKLIAERSEYSRRQAEELIEQGRVQVGGKKMTLGDKARAEDIITVNGIDLAAQDFVYYMINKPKNYITANSDKFTDKLVTELVPKTPRVYPVGRLDKDATGLLLLTNDGDFANNIMHPRYEIKKTYIAVLKEKITPGQIKKLEKGIEIDDVVITPKVIMLDNITIAVQVHVGKHKVVKRIIKAAGNYVKKLHRTHVGNLALDVTVGSYRKLNEQDKKEIFKTPKITKDTFAEN